MSVATCSRRRGRPPWDSRRGIAAWAVSGRQSSAIAAWSSSPAARVTSPSTTPSHTATPGRPGGSGAGTPLPMSPSWANTAPQRPSTLKSSPSAAARLAQREFVTTMRSIAPSRPTPATEITSTPWNPRRGSRRRVRRYSAPSAHTSVTVRARRTSVRRLRSPGTPRHATCPSARSSSSSVHDAPSASPRRLLPGTTCVASVRSSTGRRGVSVATAFTGAPSRDSVAMSTPAAAAR